MAYDVQGTFKAIKETFYEIMEGLFRTVIELEWYYKVIMMTLIILFFALFFAYAWRHKEDIHVYDF